MRWLGVASTHGAMKAYLLAPLHTRSARGPIPVNLIGSVRGGADGAQAWSLDFLQCLGAADSEPYDPVLIVLVHHATTISGDTVTLPTCPQRLW